MEGLMSIKDRKNNLFVKWLLQELESRGWSREELARRAGVQSSSLTHIVNGDRNVGADVARGIAKGLGVPQVEVFTRAGLIDDVPALKQRERVGA
jgi:transcriptional regulator with XRE-family HTH domain